MWTPRSGEFPPPLKSHRRTSLQPLKRTTQASQAHTRRQSTSNYRPPQNLNSPVDQKPYNNEPTPRHTYRKSSLEDSTKHLYGPRPNPNQTSYSMTSEHQQLHLHKYAVLALPVLPSLPEILQPQPPNGRTKMLSNSFSLPWNLTASYYNSKSYGGSTSKPPTPQKGQQHLSGLPKKDGRPSRSDAVKVSAPQDIDGDGSPDDREMHGARIVRNSFSSNNRSLYSSTPADYREELKKVYNEQSTAYWAGRFMSINDRLQIIACGVAAEQSLMVFKKAFEKRVRKGADW